MAEAARAARVGDPFKHSSALVGFAVGAIGAALVCAVVVASAGTALVVIAAVGAVGAGLGVLADNTLLDAPVPGMKSGVLEQGTSDVWINGRPAIAIGDSGLCFIPIAYQHGHKSVVEGSKTVRFGCRPASRMRDKLICDATIAGGSEDVVIGGPAVRVKGTRRSLLDDVLDYGSVFLTALGVTSGAGFLVLLASSGVSYVMNRFEAPAWLSLGVTKALQFFSPWGGVKGSMSSAAVDAAFSQKYDTYAAWKNLQIEEFNRTGVLPKGLKNPPTLVPKGRYYNQYWTPHNKPMKPPPKPPKVAALDAHAGKIFGAGLAVDVFIMWRDGAREEALGEYLNEGISCDNDDWLEPA